ncbi:hypothetical protein PDJ96_08665 [Bacillus cereus group sp. BY17LC]|uniref:hypothetical protein n=1 Tax=unclassified Bacillus cereus group TaxID=2750818 RepID=UPI0022E8B767|nr:MULTISPECIES: hypothetical protein [unclassified Bacillus cereus group]MDA1577798.1 hypothetical protein [Bacillus cereus group sp. TH228LC]MDA1836793.1 hypothetical protein [Bacillus cereus group sp. BY17LC]
MKSKLLRALTCSALLMGVAACGSNGVAPHARQLKNLELPQKEKNELNSCEHL